MIEYTECIVYVVSVWSSECNIRFVKLCCWTRTSRSHDISGPVHQVSVLVVLDGGACPGALHAPAAAAGSGSRGTSSTAHSHTRRAKTSRTHQPHATESATRSPRPELCCTQQSNNGTVARQTSDNWYGVSSMLLRGRTGGRCGRGATSARALLGRPPALRARPGAGGLGPGTGEEGFHSDTCYIISLTVISLTGSLG